MQVSDGPGPWAWQNKLIYHRNFRIPSISFQSKDGWCGLSSWAGHKPGKWSIKLHPESAPASALLMTRGFSRTEFNLCHSLSNSEIFYHPKIMRRCNSLNFCPLVLWWRRCPLLLDTRLPLLLPPRYSAQPHCCLETNFRNWYLLREDRGLPAEMCKKIFLAPLYSWGYRYA